MNINTESKKTSKGCMSLFAGIFFFAGLFPGYMALSSVYRSLAANQWEPVPVTIVAADIQYNDDSKKATAKYRYQYGGQSYTSEQVSFGKMSDNFSSFHDHAYQELKRYRNSGQPFTAWVNPNDPSEAVLYKNIRWAMVLFLLLFMLVFSGAGAGLYIAGLYGIKAEKKQQLLKQQYPDKPWMWQAQWQQKTLSSQGSAQRWLATGFAIVWNLISLPIAFIFPRELAKGNYMILVAGLFPLVGIGLIIWAIRSWRQHYRFGESKLILKHLPIARGSLLDANLQLPAAVPGGIELKLSLNCIRITESSSGGKTQTKESILWQSDQRIPIPPTGGSYRLIPIRFQIPTDQPEARPGRNKGGVIWRLQIDSKIPGVDYQATFELPVFTTSTEDITADHARQNLSQETGLPGVPTATGAIIEGQRYYFPPARHKLVALNIFIFGAIFGGIGVLMIYKGHPIFGGVFALVGLLIFWGVLALLFKRQELIINNGSLIASAGWFGLKQKLNIPGFQIKKFSIKSNMSVGTKKYYDLYLHSSDGKTHKLAGNLLSRRNSEALITRLEHDLGVSNS